MHVLIAAAVTAFVVLYIFRVNFLRGTYAPRALFDIILWVVLTLVFVAILSPMLK